MAARVLTALLGAPLLLLAAWLGGLYLAAAVALLVLLAQHEFVRLIGDLSPHRGLVFAGGLVLVAAAYFNPGRFPDAALFALLLLYLGAFVFFFPRIAPGSLAGTLLGAVYPGLLAYLYLLRALPDGWLWLLLVLVVTWAFDIFGYFTGMVLGRIRMTPNLSPKKTVEGLAGGILAAVAVAAAGGFFIAGKLDWPFIVLGLLIGAAAQAGDLAASALKRFAGVKDAGRLLPGHGGVLDRFDSMLVSAPLGYYLIQWLILR
ncbi:MAG: phosphatidate cytidylyltransferase [Bacillota bacterium]